MRPLLKEYAAKRKFKKTPEPKLGEGTVLTLRTQPPVSPFVKGELKSVVESGLSPTNRLIFVIQKHAARRLHYDLRLEMEGVLKSWAVPKGPSLNPSLKRLAIMVEDHPFDYKDFEGVIPEGNYGAGSVIIWDTGFYHHPSARDKKENEKLLLDGLRKGDLKFVLEGKKLQGEFALVKTGMAEKSWLLLKKKDQYVTKDDILKENRSVVSNMTLEDVFEGRGQSHSTTTLRSVRKLGQSPKSLEKSSIKKIDQIRLREAQEMEDLKDAPIKSMSHNIKPMLATLIKEPFDHPDWIFEVKWDGYRVVAEIRYGNISLYSRNQISLNQKFFPVVNSLKKLRFEAVLDGEIVVVDDQGRPDFQMLQNYQKSGNGHLLYYVFDLLHFNGHDLTNLTLLRRKELLKKILPSSPKIKFSDHISKEGVLFFNVVKKKGLEGIVAKHSQSAYRMGRRSRQWLKVKTQLTQEGVIAGFTEPGGGRKYFGSLVLGAFEGNELIYIGHSGGGFTAKNLKELREKLDSLIQKECPFKVKPETNTPVTWLKPELVCEVAFHGWTENGLMRQPVFLRMREDKTAREVAREKP